MKVLIACTGNSCRSPMAKGFLKSFNERIEVLSAGTQPEKLVNPYAVKVMAESHIDIYQHKPCALNQYTNEAFDCIICLSNSAKWQSKELFGSRASIFHITIADPMKAKGTHQQKLDTYRQTRDEIKNELFTLYIKHLKHLVR